MAAGGGGSEDLGVDDHAASLTAPAAPGE